jgi:hypothetical protein
LLGYIAQIAILQLLRKGLGTGLTMTGLVASFLAAVVLTILSVEAIDRARPVSPFVDKLYAAVFS